MNATSAAKALAWFSVGLGLAELIAPGWLSRQIGISERPKTARAFGVREIAAGAGILAAPRAPHGMWARAVGDVIDLGALGLAARQSKHPGRLGVAVASVAAVLAVDAAVARRLSGGPSSRAHRH